MSEAGDLFDMLHKAVRQMNLNAGIPVLADKIVCGQGVVAKLRAECATTEAPLPAGTLLGIKVIHNPLLADDQWVAFDRHDNVIAMGRGGSWRVPLHILKQDVRAAMKTSEESSEPDVKP